MKKNYTSPEIDLLTFLAQDVITDSPDDVADDIFDLSQNVGSESGDDSAEDQFGAVGA